MAVDRVALRLPVAYRAFFLVVEPVSALAGAFYSHFRQRDYLDLLDGRGDSTLTTSTSVALSQLANMYLFFALVESLVLRSTWDLRVWRTLLLVLLLADLGHLYSLQALGTAIYYDVTAWNISLFFNIPWVYAGATLRLCFLAGVGMQHSKRR
ncbi:hypothetical protein CDD80_4415 [Ophiocordyceps camponoti-rufipedis]|uniref:DUF7704 domain-containing protein n=1 Tax=Ophiocordyceps camponoti-rufipedis TaxID=2004952 RepID=A0A2C5YUZ5_9HYPO|nr:hypothetical protein CDD80_4415 [Ophiocordyceps camponoti-rufipedis]